MVGKEKKERKEDGGGGAFQSNFDPHGTLSIRVFVNLCDDCGFEVEISA